MGHNRLMRCVETTFESAFGVSDGKNTEPAYLTSFESGTLKVRNHAEEQVALWKIDHCTFQSGDQARCDCALISEDLVVFVEMKDAKVKSRRIRRQEAYRQLSQTLEDFHQNIPARMTRKALVVFELTGNYPASRTDTIFQAKSFEDNFNTQLLEGNHFIF